tara:strand:- start:138 stop:383 length:246 start_codon:yes stop_codon:yes gene_type:complete
MQWNFLNIYIDMCVEIEVVNKFTIVHVQRLSVVCDVVRERGTKVEICEIKNIKSGIVLFLNITLFRCVEDGRCFQKHVSIG